MKPDEQMKRLREHVIVDHVHWITCAGEMCDGREIMTYVGMQRSRFAEHCFMRGWMIDEHGQAWCPDCVAARKRNAKKDSQ